MRDIHAAHNELVVIICHQRPLLVSRTRNVINPRDQVALKRKDPDNGPSGQIHKEQLVGLSREVKTAIRQIATQNTVGIGHDANLCQIVNRSRKWTHAIAETARGKNTALLPIGIHSRHRVKIPLAAHDICVDMAGSP